MKVIKEAKLTIVSRIENLDSAGLAVGEVERSETSVSGFYHYDSEGEIRLTYSESGEGGESRSEVICAEGCVTVRRRGAVESEFRFREGVRHTSVYSVVPYRFDAEIMPKRVRISLDADGGRLDLLYAMKIGGADKNVRMRIEVSARSAEARG